ncbi:hypothetical protein TKK_0015432 [Trichogramma kaykai]|uniref:CCHC-type domain-containing protein n=1 Tax=Trichogramma kaykai TaxID=54128 RepID=A0ABD2WA63_9HYME
MLTEKDVTAMKGNIEKQVKRCNTAYITQKVKEANLNTEGDREVLVDRLIRYRYRTEINEREALWDPDVDEQKQTDANTNTVAQKSTLNTVPTIQFDPYTDMTLDNTQIQHLQDSEVKGSSTKINHNILDIESNKGDKSPTPSVYGDATDIFEETVVEKANTDGKQVAMSENLLNMMQKQIAKQQEQIQELTMLLRQATESTIKIQEQTPSTRVTKESTTHATQNVSRTINKHELKETSLLIQKFELSFAGKQKEDPELFLDNIQIFQDSTTVEDSEILVFMPTILKGEARTWARPFFNSWTTLEEFKNDFRLQYGIINLQDKLQDEIRTRTQGADEPIASYLTNIKALMNRVVPRMTEEQKLRQAYKNLHPWLLKEIKKRQFNTFQELLILGQEEEARRDSLKRYKPPPSPAETAFPENAYNAKKYTTNKTAAIASATENEISAIQTIPPKQKTEQTQRKPPDASHTPPKRREPKSPEDQEKIKKGACWICLDFGHWSPECPQKKELICYKCKTPGYKSNNCPNCNKNQGKA